MFGGHFAEIINLAQNTEELLDWLNKPRGKDTLKEKDAEKIHAALISAGCKSLQSIKRLEWTTIENMKLEDRNTQWLSVWLPRVYGEEEKEEIDLTGCWEDDMGGRRCYLKKSPFNKRYYVGEENETKNNINSFIGINFADPLKIILKAPWGKNKSSRTWEGVIENNGTRIKWNGRRGESFWYKI